MFWFFVQSLWKRDSWTSKMTTKMFWFFVHRAVEICDLRGKCFDFLCKARGNLWFKGPCTKPFPRGGMRFWVKIFCSKPVEICDFKIFHWTSKMTTFWTRSPSVSCDLTVLFQFRTDIDFLCKARGNLWFKGPCTNDPAHPIHPEDSWVFAIHSWGTVPQANLVSKWF